jgi:hypothetical protein
MALTEIIHRVRELCEIDGKLTQNHAVSTGVPLVMADPEAIDECVRETVWRRVGTLSKQLSRPCHPSRATAPAPAPAPQAVLPRLRAAQHHPRTIDAGSAA